MRVLFLNLFVVAACSLECRVFADDSPPFSRLIAHDSDFIVRSYKQGPSAAELLDKCRALRVELQCKWLGTAATETWRPRCEVIVHATRGSYLRAVGRSGGQTSGSSLIQSEKDRIIARRIDLLVDQQGRVTALPHELTHVVLADRFGSRRPPRWVDEGIATLADSAEKRTLHWRDCLHALDTGTAMRMFDLLTLERFTSARQVPAFYGQSLSLTRFLVEQDEPRKIVVFSEDAMDKGYDQALRECYGIDGVRDLERRWRDYAVTSRTRTLRATVIPVGHQP